ASLTGTERHVLTQRLVQVAGAHVAAPAARLAGAAGGLVLVDPAAPGVLVARALAPIRAVRTTRVARGSRCVVRGAVRGPVRGAVRTVGSAAAGGTPAAGAGGRGGGSRRGRGNGTSLRLTVTRGRTLAGGGVAVAAAAIAATATSAAALGAGFVGED